MGTLASEAGITASADSPQGTADDQHRCRLRELLEHAARWFEDQLRSAAREGARAKYLNGPETPLFSKSRTLYGLPEARRLVRGGAAVLVVVEGYFDVIACQRAGLAAVAPMGNGAD